jgi:hypothetical protein
MNKIQLSNSDMLNIQKIMAEYNKDNCTIIQTPTGIGSTLEVHLEMGENKVLVCDITDYKLW